MLTVNPNTNTRKPSRNDNLQSRKITRMDNIRTQFSENSKQLGIQLKSMARGFIQCKKIHITPSNSMAKISNFCQSQNHMPISIYRHVINQIYNSIFQPAGIKSIHNMQHQRTLIRYSRHNL